MIIIHLISFFIKVLIKMARFNTSIAIIEYNFSDNHSFDIYL